MPVPATRLLVMLNNQRGPQVYAENLRASCRTLAAMAWLIGLDCLI